MTTTGTAGTFSGAKMGIQEFGDRLIETRDLDPVYCGLVGAGLPEPQLCRWLLAYWCFYHVGVASYLSEFEGEDYWNLMTAAAWNNDPDIAPKVVLGYYRGENKDNNLDRWPRAPERRHFRGTKCVCAVEWLWDSSVGEAPEYRVRSLSSVNDEKVLMRIVQQWPMFGPWIAFKAADMMERVYGARVMFDRNLGLMYEEPRRGLDLLAERLGGGDYRWWYQRLMLYFSARPAPPREDRSCGPQEVETVLCKWKSYMGGSYHLGKDIREQRAVLVGWGATAHRIAAAYPPEVTHA